METHDKLSYDRLDTPLGPLWMVMSRKGLSYLAWDHSESDFFARMRDSTGAAPARNAQRLRHWHSLLHRYFSSERIIFDRAISFMRGTPFQKKVWQKLAEIPYGEVRSYQWIADQLSLGRAARAVGNACGKNPLPIVLPCHRVIHQDGSLGGYTGGLAIKKKLLAIEKTL
ncbi:MAG: methylated-DNA--[protein]-cysteine S-methyltransferase [Nitrospiria bacterium]